MTDSWAITDDLSRGTVVLTVCVLVLSVVLLLVEQRKAERRSPALVITGTLACLALAGAVLRPVLVSAHASQIGPRIAVLLDGSRRMQLPLSDRRTRADAMSDALDAVAAHYKEARLSSFEFGEGRPKPVSRLPTFDAMESDLSEALAAIKQAPGERPRAIVVLSDGRLTRPVEGAPAESLRALTSGLDIPIHTISLVDEAPNDASIRSVRAAGAAVAHQPLVLTVDVGCASQLACERLPVRIVELLQGEPPIELAQGTVQVENGVGSAEFEVTLDRSGMRVLRVTMDAPKGDVISANDSRYIAFSVARERIRLLHLAGRPTYDVRALRTWLKSDESVDVVAFFILRGETDDPEASEAELALIRFPVDELFTEHLPSFDAIILQDIDAVRYKLSRYLPRLERYVKKGGGLIMVGGPSSFAGGNYAGTPLDAILPVEQPRGEEATDPTEFVPSYTEPGLVAPVTSKLRSLLGAELPRMSGANLLGAARAGAIVLWEHPKRTVAGRGMPVLALGEAGDGRSIAMGVDATHGLAFGELASGVSGRSYGALWDGLLGWLMRDPRYEAARVEVVGECIAGRPLTLRVHRLPGMAGDIKLTVQSLGEKGAVVAEKVLTGDSHSSAELVVDPLEEGGYSARAVVGAAPATRHDFGCERGGTAWSDTRPDPARLETLSVLTGGTHVTSSAVSELPEPELAEVTASRTVSAWLPPWMWALFAAAFLGLHWLVRRQLGLV